MLAARPAPSVLRQSRLVTRPSFRPLTANQAASFRRLLSSLALLEQREGKLNVSSLAAVSAAQKLGGSITGFVAGSKGKSLAEEVAKVKGIEKVVYVENGAYDHVRKCHTRDCTTKMRWKLVLVSSAFTAT